MRITPNRFGLTPVFRCPIVYIFPVLDTTDSPPTHAHPSCSFWPRQRRTTPSRIYIYSME